jgi:hypothetical protein
MNDFTHAILDFDGEVIRKVRWSNTEYKWYTDNFPSSKIVKLEVSKPENTYSKMLNLVGECLL